MFTQAAKQIARLMDEDDVIMLRHNWVSLQSKGADLVIGGMDDSGIGWTGADPAEKDIPEILKDAPKGLPIIWLGHRPTSFDKVIGLPVALTLSGHTHGGQLRIPFGGPGLADIAFKHAMGLYKVGGPDALCLARDRHRGLAVPHRLPGGNHTHHPSRYLIAHSKFSAPVPLKLPALSLRATCPAKSRVSRGTKHGSEAIRVHAICG